MKPVYKKLFGLLHDPRVAEEIAALDAHKDAQRIAHLLGVYEFSWDFSRALELALFYTYGSVPVSQLLARTAEFEKYGQKRYDDTAILIGHFVESGWDGEFGRKALERMNKTHGQYTIPNDDFLFVLWTFIDFPMRRLLAVVGAYRPVPIATHTASHCPGAGTCLVACPP